MYKASFTCSYPYEVECRDGSKKGCGIRTPVFSTSEEAAVVWNFRMPTLHDYRPDPNRQAHPMIPRLRRSTDN